MQTFKKFHRRKHEKSERMFSPFAFLWRHTISRRPRTHAYQWLSGITGAFEKGKNLVNLVCPRMSYLQAIFVNIATRFWRWKFRIRNSYPMERISSILQWRLLKFNCCLCFQASVSFLCLFVLRASFSDDLTGREVTSPLISLYTVSELLCLPHKQRQGLQICVVIYHLALPRSMVVAIEQITWNQLHWLKLLHASYIFLLR